VATPEELQMFPWWRAAEDDDPEAATRRSLAWLEHDPVPKITAQVRYVSRDQMPELLRVVRAEIERGGVENYEWPTQLEAYLLGLLRGCAVAFAISTGRGDEGS
jgi:hypothetical protein